jgi:hypothetical protein
VSITLAPGGLVGGVSITLTPGGLVGGVSITLAPGGLVGGVSITLAPGGLVGGVSINAKTGLATAQLAIKATRLSFMAIAPSVFVTKLCNADCRGTETCTGKGDRSSQIPSPDQVIV